MAKIISANNIFPNNIITTNEEVVPIRLLIARHYDISSKVNLEFVYDNSETKVISIALGDNVKVTYTDDSGNLQEITGVIIDICNKAMASSFKSNSNMGNGNYNLQIKIDASEENDSKVESIYLINIFDIEPAEIDPGEDPVIAPISWKEEPISVKDGLLTIPYNRSEPGTVILIVSHGEDVVVFREEFEANTVNENATFTWSLRDFSSLNGTSIEGLNYDEEGNYIYHNGDNSIEEVKAIDIDDSKIIPAKTALNINISHFDSLNTESKISTVYTVTEEDVTNVTSGYTTPVEPSNPEVTKYTITTNVTNGTVNVQSVEVDENSNTTIIFTPDEGYDKVEVTVNGIVDDASILDGKVTLELTSIAENKDIEVVFSKTITSTVKIENGKAMINVVNTTEKDIPIILNIESDDTVIYTEENTVKAANTIDFVWNLRQYYKDATEEELYNIENTNIAIINAGNYTYNLAYGDKVVSESITISEEDIENAKNDACWIYGDNITVEGNELAIRYNRLVPGDVQLIIKANDNIVFKEEYTFSTTNERAAFTWSMRDFSSLNNTSIEGLHYDEDGVYVYHNGDNSIEEVKAIDLDNSKIIPAGTVLDITITRGKSILTKQYTVTEEDVTALTF